MIRLPGHMHSATLEGSKQLRALLEFLESVGAAGATAREIRLGTGGLVESVSAAQ